MTWSNLSGLLEPLLKEVSNGVTVADARSAEMSLIYVNPGFERLTGYAAAEVLGRDCLFLQGSGTDSRQLAQLRRALGEGVSCRALLRHYRKDHTVFLDELKLSPVLDEAGRLTHFVGIHTDVTAALIARTLQHDGGAEFEFSQAWSEVRGRSRQPGDPLAVVVSDRLGQLLFVNRAFSRLIGKRASELLKTSLFEYFDAAWLGQEIVSADFVEREWRPVELSGEVGRAFELKHYRLAPVLAAEPLHLLLLRPFLVPA